MAHSDKTLEYSEFKLSKESLFHIKKFTEKLLSFLILKAFESKRNPAGNSSPEHESSTS